MICPMLQDYPLGNQDIQPFGKYFSYPWTPCASRSPCTFLIGACIAGWASSRSRANSRNCFSFLRYITKMAAFFRHQCCHWQFSVGFFHRCHPVEASHHQQLSFSFSSCCHHRPSCIYLQKIIDSKVPLGRGYVIVPWSKMFIPSGFKLHPRKFKCPLKRCHFLHALLNEIQVALHHTSKADSPNASARIGRANHGLLQLDLWLGTLGTQEM